MLVANLEPGAINLVLPVSPEEAHRLAPGRRGWEPIEVAGPKVRLGPYATLRLAMRVQDGR